MRGVVKESLQKLSGGFFPPASRKGHKISQDFTFFFYQKGRVEDKAKRQQQRVPGAPIVKRGGDNERRSGERA